jgi:hypothetical protein
LPGPTTTTEGVTVSFAERLAADVATHRVGPECKTCSALAGLNPDDLAAYHEAVESGISQASIGRALGLQPGTYRLHKNNRHVDPR